MSAAITPDVSLGLQVPVVSGRRALAASRLIVDGRFNRFEAQPVSERCRFPIMSLSPFCYQIAFTARQERRRRDVEEIGQPLASVTKN